MLKLNTLLVEAGIDPHTTIVARHRPFEPALRKVMPWIAAERPDLFKVYQQTHGLGSVDKMPDPQTGGCDKDEGDIAVGGLVVSGGQSAAVLEL